MGADLDLTPLLHGAVFKGDEDRAEGARALAALRDAAHFVAAMAQRTGSRKLVQAVRVLDAVAVASFCDPSPKALDGADAWAKGRPPVPQAPMTAQEKARELAAKLEGTSSTRGRVARFLAFEVEAFYGRLRLNAAELKDAADRVYAKMPILHGNENDRSRVLVDHAFSANAHATVIAAFKACGMSREEANQLFAAAKVASGREVKRRQARTKQAAQ